MGAAPSHEEPARGDDARRPPPPSRPSLGPRPTNVRHLAPAAPGDAAALPAALFRDAGRPPRDLRPIEYRPPVQQSEIVRNVVSLAKSSLRLVRADEDPFVQLVEFEFDADVDGHITIYYCAKETVERVSGSRDQNAPVLRVSYSGKGEALPVKTKFGVGRKQKYRQKVDKGLDVRKFTTAELKYKPESDRCPVVIRLEASYPPDSTLPEHMRVKSQTTFASVAVVDGVYHLQVVAQQVLVGGTIYRVQDLYGIGATDVTATKQSDPSDPDVEDAYKVDTTHECVICLTEPCNTAVLPCNHLCLCDDCARILCTETDYQRRKCPVCRTQLGSLLRIISAPNNATSEESSSAEAGSTLPDNSTAAATITRSDSDVPSSEITIAPSTEGRSQVGEDDPHHGTEIPPESSEGVNEGSTVAARPSAVA